MIPARSIGFKCNPTRLPSLQNFTLCNHIFSSDTGSNEEREDLLNDHAHAIKIQTFGTGCCGSSLSDNQHVPQLGRLGFQRVPAAGMRFAVVKPATRDNSRPPAEQMASKVSSLD